MCHSGTGLLKECSRMSVKHLKLPTDQFCIDLIRNVKWKPSRLKVEANRILCNNKSEKCSLGKLKQSHTSSKALAAKLWLGRYQYGWQAVCASQCSNNSSQNMCHYMLGKEKRRLGVRILPNAGLTEFQTLLANKMHQKVVVFFNSWFIKYLLKSRFSTSNYLLCTWSCCLM